MTGRVNPNPGIDRDLLHRYWWRKAGRRKTMKIVQTEWAEQLGINNNTLSRVMKEMISEGRIRKVGYCLYAIKNPDTYDRPRGSTSSSGSAAEPSTGDGESKPPPRRPAWG